MERIGCRGFPCLDLLGDILEREIQKDTDKRRVNAVRGIFENLRFYFSVVKRAGFNGGDSSFHFEGIERHLGYINEYLDTGDIKQKCGYMRPEDI